MKSLSNAQTTDILSLLDLGQSIRQISQTTGVHYSTISRIRSKLHPTLAKAIGGRPTKISSTLIRHATRLITSGKADTAVDVTKSLQNVVEGSISTKTMRRALKKAGMKAVVKKKRPLLLKRHRKERLDFAISHQDWTMEDWKRVVWSDETKINCLGSDGRKWAWKKAGEKLGDRLVKGTLKFGGGSLMMWGCMSWDGVGYACKIDGKMDANLYVSILDDELTNSLEYWGKNGEEVVFQQDNDPKHTSRKAKEWLQSQDFETMIWPAQSPDLNPIEHLWGHLKKRMGEYEEAPKGITELWERVQVEWEKIGAGVCQNLIESMPRRVEAVLKAKGGYTKY